VASRARLRERNLSSNQAFLVALIRREGCPVCGPVPDYVDLMAFEAHHVDGNEKEREISEVMRLGAATFQAEMAKCVMMHCGCHRRLHHLLGNRGAWRDLPRPGEDARAQLDRLILACRAEVEGERRAQGYFFA
jgi:hypothetical protein